MKLALINPNIVTQKGDFLGSGIPYMPVSLASLAAYLREKCHDVSVIDAFGERPSRVREEDGLLVQGLGYDEILHCIPENAGAVIVYASSIMSFEILLNIIRHIRKKLAKPVIVAENSQSVTAFSLESCYRQLVNAGADFLIMGDLELRMELLLKSIQKRNLAYKKIDGIIYKNKHKIAVNPVKNFQKNLDILPFPAWDLFPLRNYWKLGYSHGPLSSKKYLTLLTSRGCAFSCGFCIAPGLNKGVWRAKSAKRVVDEMAYWGRKYGVREFHLEDLNPTIDKIRTNSICNEILKRKLDVIWKLAAGSKIETVDEHTIKLMAKAGCKSLIMQRKWT
ncbi:MAG: hypothetical protein KJ955_02485 [Nanoarchaeota archaeon]|nr:hypothetical protein [Nanoarchaeota archaeon]